jgi:hypothetical protein
MTSKGKYHLLPAEEDTVRDSFESVSRPITNVSKDSSSNRSSKSRQYGFKALHITFYLRFISSALFLTAVILLAGKSKFTIPGTIFLCLALARNFYVMLGYLLSGSVKFEIGLTFLGNSGKAKSISPKRPRTNLIPLVIDITILVALFITLPIGIVKTRAYTWWGYQGKEVEGFIVGLTGL